MVSLKFPIKNGQDIYVFSASVLIIAFLVAHVIASLVLPSISESLSLEIQKMVITINGVLFGFTGVMVGLFTRNTSKISKKNLKKVFILSTIAFFSFIFSMLFSFLLVAFGQETLRMAPLTPLIVMIFGAVCSAIYLPLTFFDNAFRVDSE
jgi:hypothetical protein